MNKSNIKYLSFEGGGGKCSTFLGAIKALEEKKIYLFGILRKIYTGFNGPATGAYHEKTKDDFIRIITTLLSEK